MSPNLPMPAAPTGSVATGGPARPDRLGPLWMLMRREWMQNRLAWSLLVALPVLFVLGVMVWAAVYIDTSLGGTVQIDVDDADVRIPLAEQPAALQTMALSVSMPALVMVVTGLAVLFQLTSLARRDMDDRSLAFWRTLPVSDAASVAASTAMHVLVLPAAAWVMALVAAQVSALIAIVISHGPMAWVTQPWGQLLPALAAWMLRGLLGVVLAVVWASPVVMLLLAASAWFKRWGAPIVVVMLFVGDQLVDRLLPAPMLGPALDWLAARVASGFFSGGVQWPTMQVASQADLPELVLPIVPELLLRDAGRSLAQLAQPGLVPVLALAALGFVLTVWRRRRG